MAAAAVSDFVRSDSWRQICVRDVSFSLYAKFYTNICSRNLVIAHKLNFKMLGTAIFDFVKNVKLYFARR